MGGNLVLIFFSAVIFFSVIGFLSFLFRSPVQEKLERLTNRETIKQKAYRLVREVGESLQQISFLRDIVNLDLLGAKLRMAGLKIGPADFLGIWASSILGSFILALLTRSVLPGFFVPFLILLGIAVPKSYLDKGYRKKRVIFRKQFIAFAERVRVGLAGGVGFFRVLQWASQSNSLFAGEIQRVVEEVQAGTSLEDALDNFARRMDDQEVINFVTTIKNAERKGAFGYSKALASLIADIRKRRGAQIDEVAKMAEVKLIFPVVLTVFPATAILLLGPMAIYAFAIFY